ncbi:MAG: 50S ribosomal protein L14e [Nanoarchaeota archaeon]
MIEIGRVCIKTAGRDAGLKCVIVEILDDKFVLIDGETRRRKCNILHLEPLKEVIKIKKGASHEDVSKEFEALGLRARETAPKQKTERPSKKRKTPEQLRAKKEEKRKLRDMFKPKKKEDKKGSLEEITGIEENKGQQDTGAKEEGKQKKAAKKKKEMPEK